MAVIIIKPTAQPPMIVDDADLTAAAITLTTFTGEGTLRFAIIDADETGGTITIEGQDSSGITQSETLRFTTTAQTMETANMYAYTNLAATPATFTQGTVDVVFYDSAWATYNAQIEGIRRIASPDLSARLTETQLPEAVIADPVYLDAVEREVLRESAIAAADVSSLTPERHAQVVYLVQVRLAIEFIPQLPQLIQQSIFSSDSRYATVDWETRLEKLEAIYLEALKVVNPAANVVDTSTIPVQGTTTASEEIDFDVPYYSRTELYGRTI